LKPVVRIGVVALLALAILANGALAAAIVLTREPAPRTLSAERVATASKPAIVFIQSDYTITTSMTQPAIKQNAVEQALQPRVDSGEIRSADQWQQAADRLVFANPDAYYANGNSATDTWNYWATGSGFFVTEDGYVVTAAHVVTASKAEVRDSVIAETKTQAFVDDFKNTIKKTFSEYSATDAELNNFVDFWQRWIDRYISVDKIDARYFLGSGASVQAGDGMTSGGIRASVVSVDPTVGGHDIAILKADVSGVPSLAIAGSDPQLGDATYALGYPRTAYLQETVPTNQAVPIAVTNGKVQRMTSRSSADGSWKVYGTDAQFTHGDSGGPVVDARGNVMGVISFIVPDANGNQLPGQGYFVPSSFIREDLAKANVSIAPDRTSTNLTDTYYRALAKGDSGRYREELNLLLSIQSRSARDTYVTADIGHAQAEIAAGNDRTPSDLSGYVLPGTGSAAGVILVALLTWLVLALATGRTSAAPAEPAPATPLAAE
jgi:serine protease Do